MNAARCHIWFKRVRCCLSSGHSGMHEAEFPRYHCHVDEQGRATPDVEQPYQWAADKGKRRIRRVIKT